MSKKEKIKKYLEEHEEDIVMGIAFGVGGALAAMFGFEAGARTACTDFAKCLTAVTKERGVDIEYKVIGNALKGFDIVPKT